MKCPKCEGTIILFSGTKTLAELPIHATDERGAEFYVCRNGHRWRGLR